MLKTRLFFAAAALFGFSSAANAAGCSSGFLADLACRAGIIDQDTARTLDRANAALGHPVDNAIYNGMDYVVPGAGTAARMWPQIRNGGPGPDGPGPMQAPPPPPYYAEQRYASVCVTGQGVVPMMAPVPIGGSCYAVTPYGNVPGVAR